MKRCTACGLDVTRVFLVPDAASPWPGFERGVIECKSCGYSTSDDLARRGRIQKCGQCAKVLYIPSGLYRNSQPNLRVAQQDGSVWFAVKDVIGSQLSRLSRSKARLPIFFLVIVLGIGLLFGLNAWKNQSHKVDLGPSPLETYYKQTLTVDNQLKSAETEFQVGVGGLPGINDYNDKVTPNNQARFVRNTDRVLSQVEILLNQVYGMQGNVPAGAESHYAKLKTKLEERQRYYARLKDGVNQKNQDRWKEAFSNADVMKTSNTNEEQALTQLQDLVLRQSQTAPKA